ncbi:major facilitator superfamily domain-containing protein [Fennellomyces sp. T-0311]|nr:major facilitator superfamily domain-containing protein [Fennellomyces sp. T-0311]
MTEKHSAPAERRSEKKESILFEGDPQADELVFDEKASDTSYNAAERRLLRKLDWRLIPILGLLIMFRGFEKKVITNAKLGGLLEGTNMTEAQYRWTLSIFYFGFIVFKFPCCLIIRLWRPSLYLAILAFTWGSITMAMAAVKSYSGMLGTRFALGFFEAGFYPGVAYYTAIFYTRNEFARRYGFATMISSITGATNGLTTYGISHIPTSDKVDTWQWMFIIVGAPCILVAVVAFLVFPDKPETAKFLTEEERKLEIERMAADQGAANDNSWSWKQVGSAFKDWKTYWYLCEEVTSSVAFSGVSLALPSIIDGIGDWTEDVSLALTTPPSVVTVIFLYILTYFSDKCFARSIPMIVGNLICILGLLLLMFVPKEQVGVRYFAVCISRAASTSLQVIASAWYNNNFSGLTRRAAANGIISTMSSVGSAVGGQIYFDGPDYFWGNCIALIFMVINTMLVIGLRFTLIYINKKRDQMTPEEKEKLIESYGDDREILGDRHPDFRYAV